MFLSLTPSSPFAGRYWNALEQSYLPNPSPEDIRVATFHNSTYGPDFKYAEFGPMFDATFYDPDYWADLFKRSGIKYLCA